MNCIVTGGAGFIGSNLVDRLVQDGNEVNLKAFKSLRILRSLRVLRVTKLLRSLEFMKVII